MVPAGPDCPRRPTPLVRLACGSMSTSSTFWSAKASDAARLIVVVVFPTPPFWFVTATTRALKNYLVLISDIRFAGAARPGWLFDINWRRLVGGRAGAKHSEPGVRGQREMRRPMRPVRPLLRHSVLVCGVT